MGSEERQKTLWCGNLSENVTEELLYELFIQAGPLEDVTIPKTRDGAKRSYGFIRFKHEVSVSYAKQLMDGIVLCGRTLRLENRSTGENIVSPNALGLPMHTRSISCPDKFSEIGRVNGLRNGRDFRENDDAKHPNGRRNNWGNQNRSDHQNNGWSRPPWEGSNGPVQFQQIQLPEIVNFQQNQVNENHSFQQDHFPVSSGFVQGNFGSPQQHQLFLRQHQARMTMLQNMMRHQLAFSVINARGNFK